MCRRHRPGLAHVPVTREQAYPMLLGPGQARQLRPVLPAVRRSTRAWLIYPGERRSSTAVLGLPRAVAMSARAEAPRAGELERMNLRLRLARLYLPAGLQKRKLARARAA
ncbi:MAG: hypothetical protein MZU84_06015 [Sphingobacterium sp.]|nr:hypothetical protein [Sphingobacterium sp.]